MFIVLAVLAATTLLAAASGSSRRIPRPLPSWLKPSIYVKARRWANERGLPLAWVLSTIRVENGRGDPRALRKTAAEESYGLMQINWRAHGDRLTRMGITKEMLYDPDTNLMFGTLYLREVYDKVREALAGRTPNPPAPLDVIARLAYRGPGPVLAALRSGADWRVYSDTPVSVAHWARAMSEARALV